ncbi:secondary glycine betaine transporter BetU [Klebsiella pneumoniae]|nr:secondary glycine betaine transporter BetU [Klebsiella pneumoniae]
MAKQKFKITNWPTYNKALINRGSITFWLDDEAIQAWYESAAPSSRGRPQRYSDLAITTVLVIKRVFRLTLRAAQGFIDSIFSLMNVPLRCPDYSCVSRRAKSVNVSFKTPTRGEIAHLVIDSTGGIVAIALLLAGGLSALQTVTIASALPFSVILLISIYGLLKALRRDLTKRESLSMATIAPTAARNPIPWQRRLRNIAYLPKRSLVKRFMDDVIQPAMTLVQEELNKQGTISHISDAVEDRIRLEVDLGNELNFIYEVRLRGYSSPTFALAAMDNNEQQTEQHRYYRAEVYLKEGGQNYDVMGWNQEQLINDILDQYEKHLHFLHLVR